MKIRRCWAVVLFAFLLAVQSSQAEEYKSAKAAVEKGNVLLDKRDFDRAIAAFTDAIRLDPNLRAAYGNRAVLMR